MQVVETATPSVFTERWGVRPGTAPAEVRISAWLSTFLPHGPCNGTTRGCAQRCTLRLRLRVSWIGSALWFLESFPKLSRHEVAPHLDCCCAWPCLCKRVPGGGVATLFLLSLCRILESSQPSRKTIGRASSEERETNVGRPGFRQGKVNLPQWSVFWVIVSRFSQSTRAGSGENCALIMHGDPIFRPAGGARLRHHRHGDDCPAGRRHDAGRPEAGTEMLVESRVRRNNDQHGLFS